MLKYAIVITALLVAPAQAQVFTGSCRGGNGSFGCTTIYAPLQSADPHIIKRDGPIDEEADRRWIAFCKPELEADEFGVDHYVYAHKGCEYGRSR